MRRWTKPACRNPPTNTLSLLNHCLDPFLTLLYPPRCLVCSALGDLRLCAVCTDQIAPVPIPQCGVCGHALAPEGLCFNCSARPPMYNRARAMGAFDGILQTAIHHFKYHDRPQLAVPLGALLASYARAESVQLNDLRFDALLPVPMHSVRRRLRGYNQSERLARIVSAELGLPLMTNALLRTRPTRPQVGLTGEARRRNLHGAFAVRSLELVNGKTFLLIDDVATSGSSLHECAATLKLAGAKAVYALTLAAG